MKQPRPANAVLSDLSLSETERSVIGKFGPPAHVSGGEGWKILDYLVGTGEREDEEFDLSFYFEEPGGTLISITRNYNRPTVVKNLFFKDTIFHTFRDPSGVDFHAASRELPEDRILIAMGIDKLQAPCSQAILMRLSRLKYFYPWIAKDRSGAPVRSGGN